MEQRWLRLAEDLGSHPGRRLDRCQERSGARPRLPSACREGRIGVRGEEGHASLHQHRRILQLGVVGRAIETHDHGVGESVGWGDRSDPDVGERGQEALLPHHERRSDIAFGQDRRGRERGGHDLRGRGIHPDRAKAFHHLRGRPAGVVRDERESLAGLSQHGDGGGRAGDGVRPPVQDTVQIEQDRVVRICEHGSSRKPLEHPDVVGHVGAKDHRQLRVPSGSGALAGALARQGEREVSVVVGRVELDRLRELAPSA